jgi:hypothetical protein
MLDRVAQVLVVGGVVLVLGASARASASDDDTYSGSRVHVSASAVVSVRELAQHERADHASAEEHLDGFSATDRFWSLNGSTLTLVGGAPRTNPLGLARVVPRVVGKAWQRIAAAHCRLGKVRRVKATKRRCGRVLRQSPAPGTRFRSDTKVDLRVGR